MFKRFTLSLIFSIGFFLLFTNNSLAYDGLNIVLQDDPVENIVTVLIDSNEAYVAGIDMGIVFSDDIVIQEITGGGEYCGMLFNAFAEGDKLYIECFNNLDVEMDGVLTTFRYSTDSDEYFFYVDQSRLDIGSLTLGSVVDINRPGEIPEDVVVVDEIGVQEVDNSVVAFLRENSLYVLGGVILFISILLVIFGLDSKKRL